MEKEKDCILGLVYALKTSSYCHIDNIQNLTKQDLEKYILSSSSSLNEIELLINKIFGNMD